MKRHAIIRVDPETGEEVRYESCTEASRELGCDRTAISRAAFKRRLACGYVWRWEDGATYYPPRFPRRKPPEPLEPLKVSDLLRHPSVYKLGQHGARWVSAGRVLSAFEGLLGDGWRGCAMELLDGFKAPLSVLLMHVAIWYTNQHGVYMESDEVVKIVEELKKECGDG